jgi:hypothetical protein
MGINLDEVKLDDYHPFDKDHCSYCVEGHKLECLEDDTTTTKVIPFNKIVGLVDASFKADGAVSGDTVDCYLTNTFNLEVNFLTTSNIFLHKDEWCGFIGTKIILDATDEYTIVDINANGYYLLDRNYIKDYIGTYAIEAYIYIYKSMFLCSGQYYETHKKTFGCKQIPLCASLVIKYYHSSQLLLPKDFYFNLGYLYGNIQE